MTIIIYRNIVGVSNVVKQNDNKNNIDTVTDKFEFKGNVNFFVQFPGVYRVNLISN